MDQVRADFAAPGAGAEFGRGVEENFRCVREPNAVLGLTPKTSPM
ncbi:hypothetical protein [Microbispora catharanthi]|nr:hypothetical protein [Microbispora catharanthi]